MKYQIVIEKAAEKFILKQSKPDRDRIIRAIYQLPEQGDIKALQGRKSKGMFRLRVGDYRIIYTVDNGKLVVRVIDAENRGQIYKRYQ